MLKILQKTSQKRIFIWNAIGSICNALSTMVYLMLTNRFFGQYEGGIVTISLALAQQMLTISNFETATFYITDGKKKNDFDVHFSTKLLLFSIAVTASIVVALYKYDFNKALIVICFCIYKCTDGFATLSSGALQREGRLDLAGMSLTFKTLTIISVFIGISFIVKDLLVASILIVIISIGWTLLVDLNLVSNFLPLKLSFSYKKIVKLIMNCLPLFLTTFLFTYIINQPKYVIDSVMSENSQNIFGIIFMPSSVISMLSLFVYRPMVTTMTTYWGEGKKKKFVSLIIRISLLLFGLTLICIIGASLIGIPVLSWLFNVDLSGRLLALNIILLGGGMYAFSMLLYNVSVILRRQNRIFFACLLAYIFALIITKPIILSFGLNGAALAYLLTNIFLSIAIIIICFIIKSKEGVDDE